uniref:DUF2202 domain-containing protein n=1 Tax=Polaribacter sp. TaxID=1920175 RepID=UPI004048173E
MKPYFKKIAILLVATMAFASCSKEVNETEMNELEGLTKIRELSNSTHMNAIETLLKQSNTPYTILPEGVFSVPELQSLYDTFKVDGSKSVVDALNIGATIEDLDIVDLQKYISETQNTQIISVYQSLQCGSRNHLRSFTGSLVFYDASYTPQFLSLEEYNSIINGTQEQCR